MSDPSTTTLGLGPFDHPWLSGLMGDPDMAQVWSATATLNHMRRFEAAWSRTLGSVGFYDEKTAERAAQRIEQADIKIADLRDGTAIDGLLIPRLVAQLRAAAGDDAVHTGGTSQDVIDTALALTLRDTTDLLINRLTGLAATLATLETRFGANPLMGRTRMQAATMITVADRVQTWRLPLIDHLDRLRTQRPMVERVQIGGASGDRAALGDKADQITTEMAAALGLNPTDSAWHTMRGTVVDHANTLALISGSLGKIGQDIALMAQQGIEDIALTGSGRSSAMPHKQNPILAELLVTLARFNAVQVSGMHQAMIHEQERSGTTWALEWMILPQMALATGRATSAAQTLCENITAIGADT